MTSHYRNRRTIAGQTESPSRKCMGRRKSAAFYNVFSCESGVPFSLLALARHRLPDLSLPALASQRIRLRPNGMAVRFSIAPGLTIMRSFVRVGVVERAVAVTQRQPARANATGHRTSIPFGHHAIPKTLALADSLSLSEPPYNCRPNGISVSQVYGVTEEWVPDSAFPCESGVPFGVSSLASHRLPHPSLPALASQRIRFSAKRNGGAVSDSASPCESEVPFGVSALARHSLPYPSQSALAGHRIRFSAKRNGGARVVSAGGVDNAVVRQGRGCRMCSGRHPTTARNCKRHRTPHLHSVWPPRRIENVSRCR